MGFDSGLRRSFAALLEQSGYLVIQARTLPEAVDMVRFERIDLVMVDFSVSDHARQPLLAEAGKRGMCILGLNSGRTGIQSTGLHPTPFPNLVLATPESPADFLNLVALAVGHCSEARR